MTKLVLLFIIVLLLTGCGNFSRGCAQLKGTDEVCISGVTYIQFSSGVTVKYDQQGKVVTCNKK